MAIFAGAPSLREHHGFGAASGTPVPFGVAFGTIAKTGSGATSPGARTCNDYINMAMGGNIQIDGLLMTCGSMAAQLIAQFTGGGAGGGMSVRPDVAREAPVESGLPGWAWGLIAGGGVAVVGLVVYTATRGGRRR